MLQYCFTSSSEVFSIFGCSRIVENIFSLDSLLEKFFILRNHWFKVLSIIIKIAMDHIIVLNLKRIKWFSQPFHICCRQAIEKASLMLQKRTSLMLFTNSSYSRKFCFSVFLLSFFTFSFFFFFLVYWDDYSK